MRRKAESVLVAIMLLTRVLQKKIGRRFCHRPFLVCEMMKGRKQKSSARCVELFYVAHEIYYRTRMSIPQSDAVVRTLSCEP